MPRPTRTFALAAALLASPALAQSAPGVTLWGSVGTEAYIVPTATLGLSAGLGQFGGLRVALRGTAAVGTVPLPDASGVLTLLGADVLLSGTGSGVNLYGGPSVAFVPGARGLALGAVLGAQGSWGQGGWGWFAESKLRYAFSTDPGTPGGVVLPGGGFGVTYRF